ncbi:MAG: hypothetical protein ACRYFS_10595 [Janthinobacterium lividum]
MPFDPYYFAVASEQTENDWGDVVKDVLRQWAEGLSRLAPRETLHLPFGIYDQCIECLETDLAGEMVEMRCIWVNIGGGGFDLSDLSGFMGERHKVVKPSLKIFTFPRLALVTGLKEAKLIPGETNYDRCSSL